MYASTAEPSPRIFTAYFARVVGPEHGAAFVRDLQAWAEGGPFRLLVVADESVVGVTDAVRGRVRTALGGLAAVVDRVAVAGAGRPCASAGALDVRHFGDDWHGAQRWLRAPRPPAAAPPPAPTPGARAALGASPDRPRPALRPNA
ncbi:hypothetical protein [Rubrivirga litoralis]|uniref:Uncharacterized protein n=1 Tax=Rubrivirga litoralis TaxID=3075598 RepID=A0ABU3BRL9_9BACT|nr:hypothetical protein [Rubrivirga sp. F394]MDT0631933.1 hypothetical protein [Rubrivirga sp. F394]